MYWIGPFPESSLRHIVSRLSHHFHDLATVVDACYIHSPRSCGLDDKWPPHRRLHRRVHNASDTAPVGTAG